MHEEAYPVFFGGHTFRLFPVYYEYLDDRKDKIPILAQLSPRHRSAITSLELRLGPGWGNPPRCWNVNRKMGLRDCISLRDLKIFMECDPSQPVFQGFSISPTFYTDFCGNLLEGILEQVPSIEHVEIDAWESVTRDSPLLKELLGQAEDAEKKIIWGPLTRCNGEFLVNNNDSCKEALGADVTASEFELSLAIQRMDLDVPYIVV